MSEKRVADILIEKLSEFGVKYIFGMPGDAVNPIVDAIRLQEKLQLIVIRHEESAAMMASAYSKLTGKLGACLGTAGPGSVHLLNGLYDAKLDRASVIAITGQVESSRIGTGYSQEVNLHDLFTDVSVFNQIMKTTQDTGRIISMACSAALRQRGVAHLNFPIDISQMPAQESRTPPSSPPTDTEVTPTGELLIAASRILNEARRIVILAGRGVSTCPGLVMQLAEKLASPILTTYPGKGTIPDSHPCNLGILGPLSKIGREIVGGVEAVLMLGTTFPYPELIPKDSKIVQVDRDPENIGKRRAVDVGIVGEMSLVLERLIKLAINERDRSFLEASQATVSEVRRRIDERASDRSKPISPYAIVKALEGALEEDAVICLDSGAATVFTVSAFRFKKQRLLVSGRLGTMGYALPAAMSAKIAFPDRQAVAVAGDGGFAMTMMEFMTAVQYKLPVIAVVFNNSKLALIRFEQMLLGYPDFSTDLSGVDFAKYAEACGGMGIRVEEPEDLDRSLAEAFRSGNPCVVDVVTSPDEIPIVG